MKRPHRFTLLIGLVGGNATTANFLSHKLYKNFYLKLLASRNLVRLRNRPARQK